MSYVHTLLQKQESPLENPQCDSIHRSFTSGSYWNRGKEHICFLPEEGIGAYTDSVLKYHPEPYSPQDKLSEAR